MSASASRRRPPLSLTARHIARIHREMAPLERIGSYTQLTDAGFVTAAEGLLAQNDGAPFWVLAYGSLIWKPAFDHVEALPCHVPGWRRSFCLNMTNWRATPEEPGLMLGLDRGGSTLGVIYRMPPDQPVERMVRLLRREIAAEEDLAWQRWVTVRAGGRTLRALAFWCAPREADAALIRLPLAQQAHRIARAVGHMGSCAEYLLNTVEHLEKLGLHDSYLWRLQELVAAEIEALPA